MGWKRPWPRPSTAPAPEQEAGGADGGDQAHLPQLLAPAERRGCENVQQDVCICKQVATTQLPTVASTAASHCSAAGVSHALPSARVNKPLGNSPPAALNGEAPQHEPEAAAVQQEGECRGRRHKGQEAAAELTPQLRALAARFHRAEHPQRGLWGGRG